MELSGRVALVTGARRVGTAVAEALARRGVDVGLTYRRSKDEAEAAAARVESLGQRGTTIEADLSNVDQCAAAVQQITESFGRLDFLVHMASIYDARPFDALTPHTWDQVMAVEMRAAFVLVQAARPQLAKARGRVVTVSDWVAASGRPRYPGFLLYYVAKSGVKALTEALALELAPDGILVNAVAPGPILAPDEMTDEERRAVERATPLGRWGGSQALADTILHLLETDFITGETIRVDGGRHLK